MVAAIRISRLRSRVRTANRRRRRRQQQQQPQRRRLLLLQRRDLVRRPKRPKRITTTITAAATITSSPTNNPRLPSPTSDPLHFSSTASYPFSACSERRSRRLCHRPSCIIVIGFLLYFRYENIVFFSENILSPWLNVRLPRDCVRLLCLSRTFVTWSLHYLLCSPSVVYLLLSCKNCFLLVQFAV